MSNEGRDRDTEQNRRMAYHARHVTRFEVQL